MVTTEEKGAYLRELSAVVVAYDCVGDTQTMEVSHDALESVSIGIICHDYTGVPHELGWETKHAVQCVH